jgi:hypothetical protein
MTMPSVVGEIWNAAHRPSCEGQRSLDLNIAVQRAHTANADQAQRVWQAVSKCFPA